jgi:hypothetical protein
MVPPLGGFTWNASVPDTQNFEIQVPKCFEVMLFRPQGLIFVA